MTNKSFLVTRPNHDATTNYLYFWTSELIKFAKTKNISIHDLAGKKATRKNFESHMKSRSIDLLLLNGHGSPNLITGHNNKPILVAGVNEKIVKGTIIYARSCQAGAILGPSLVKCGVRSFIGYKRDFMFMRTLAYTTKPLKDKLAKLFLEPSNLIPQTILKGHSTKVAVNRSQTNMKKTLRRALSSVAKKEERDAAPVLLWNLRSQVLLGDPNATITDK